MSAPRRFYKMTGSGNDFVFLDGREHRLEDWSAERIRAICHRRLGVGADGIVHIEPDPAGQAVRLRYLNADGSHADLCGNAALCAVRLAGYLGMAGAEGAPVWLETDAGPLEGRRADPGWAAELRFATADAPGPIDLALVPGEQRAFQGTVGVPHTIVLVDRLESVDVMGRGQELRFHPDRGPAGSNVNFIGSAAGDDATWAVRTYERGVEGETLACGTGTVAAALALARAGLARLPVRIRSSSGCVYSVAGRLDGPRAFDVWLRGEGRLVFTGELTEGPAGPVAQRPPRSAAVSPD